MQDLRHEEQQHAVHAGTADHFVPFQLRRAAQEQDTGQMDDDAEKHRQKRVQHDLPLPEGPVGNVMPQPSPLPEQRPVNDQKNRQKADGLGQRIAFQVAVVGQHAVLRPLRPARGAFKAPHIQGLCVRENSRFISIIHLHKLSIFILRVGEQHRLYDETFRISLVL